MAVAKRARITLPTIRRRRRRRRRRTAPVLIQIMAHLSTPSSSRAASRARPFSISNLANKP
jgi:hypothetical protein